MELPEFLLARIAEDEDWVHAMSCTCADGPGMYGPHLLPSCPTRVLAECEAKRRIVVEALESDHGFERPEPWGFGVMRILALPYADHPDYDEAWRP